MKIKIENILDKILKKFNLKRIDNKDKGKVIKFETNINENISTNEEVTRIRKGSVDVEIQEEKRKISKQGVKILASMVLLLLLTISLGIRSKDIVPLISVEQKDVSSVATSTNLDNNSNINEEEKDNNELVLATKVVEKAPVKKVQEKLVFTRPVDGEIQKMYSVDKVIYSKTLSQWKTHDGLDITGNSDVKAIEKGVVDEIYVDSFYGKTIVIEHINGYRSQYSNLDENTYVNVGESVVKGQKIGKVGNTSVGEYLDEPHLHFMLFLNDKSINPTYLYD